MCPSTTARRCAPAWMHPPGDEMNGCCLPKPLSERPAPEQAPGRLAASAGAARDREAARPIAGGVSFVGTNDPAIPQDGEGPERVVALADFLLSPTSVTNRQFETFVDATGYVTEAERLGWSPVFDGSGQPAFATAPVGDGLPWWHIVDGASWKCPEGPDSTIAERMDHPVVQVSWNDANAYADWAGGRLPREAEWEHAARGGAIRKRFPWGDEEPDDDKALCNIWQGNFPHHNSLRDGYKRTAPARSFEPNALGLFNMAGNVWEWSADAFRIRSMGISAQERNALAAQNGERVLKGGSFLCHISYCYRYRIAARIAMSPDSASSNVGFRIAFDPLESGAVA